MKRNVILTLLACGVSLALSVGLQAQTSSPTPAASPSESPVEQPGPHGHGGLLAHLTQELNLTPDQQAQIKPILQAAKPQAQAIKQEVQARRKTLLDSVSGQIMPLLTQDQQTKFSAMVQRMESAPVGGRGFGKGGPGSGDFLQHLTTQLGLTADQQAQLKPILDSAHSQIETVRSNTALAPKDKIAQIKTIMEGVKTQMNAVLTPAQQQQLAAMKGGFHHDRHFGGQPPASPAASGTPATTGS